jgi:hypothetical protein
MQILIRKFFFAVLLCLGLCACSGNSPSSKMVSTKDAIQRKSEAEWNNPENDQAYSLNNKATFFGEYLLINSMHANLIFYNRDTMGNYDSWMHPEELLPRVMGAYRHFKYKDQLVCVSQTKKGNSEIIIYDSGLVVKSRREFAAFSPQYICGTLLYGHSNSTEYSDIIAIDLETLEATDICKLELEKRPNFIINNDNEIIICEHLERDKTLFSKLENEKGLPLFEAKNSVFVNYDDRGIFYLEEDTDSYWNLMLWDGEDIRRIDKVEIDDMDAWIFFNGLPGNIIIEENFFVSIHTFTEEPYALVHDFDSKKDTHIPLKKWDFTEADMERFGETFSGIYYENGQMIYYFFSDTAGLLQTQTVDIKGTR